MKVEEIRVEYLTSVTWRRTKLSELAEIIRGVTYKKDQASDRPETGKLPILRATNIQDGNLVLDRDLVYVPKELISESQTLRAGDIVVATSSGSKHLVGKTAPVREAWRGSFGAFCAAIRPTSDIDPRYLGYFFETREYKDYISKQALGVNINNLRRGDLEEILVPVAPREIQGNIVAEIEKQFSRLDEAVANLKRVKANLKRYKAAVLKAAVEGRLVETEAEIARKKSPSPLAGEGRGEGKYETGEQLLQRVLETRRKQWKGKGKYKEPTAPDTTDLPELLEGWAWVTIEQLTIEMMNGYGKRSQTVGKPQIVFRLADIVNGEISYSDVRRINCTDDEVCKYRLSENELLILRVNGSPELVGRFVLIRQLFEDTLFCDHFIRARCVSPDLAIWLRLYTDVERFRRYVELNKVSSAGQNTINQGALLSFVVPLPPVDEQQRIFTEVDRRLSLIRKVESQVDANLKRAECLRQSILTRAFTGALKGIGTLLKTKQGLH